jgi:hypothetical protein
VGKAVGRISADLNDSVQWTTTWIARIKVDQTPGRQSRHARHPYDHPLTLPPLSKFGSKLLPPRTVPRVDCEQSEQNSPSRHFRGTRLVEFLILNGKGPRQPLRPHSRNQVSENPPALRGRAGWGDSGLRAAPPQKPGLFDSVGKRGLARDVLGPCLSPLSRRHATGQEKWGQARSEDSASQSPFPLS